MRILIGIALILLTVGAAKAFATQSFGQAPLCVYNPSLDYAECRYYNLSQCMAAINLGVPGEQCIQNPR